MKEYSVRISLVDNIYIFYVLCDITHISVRESRIFWKIEIMTSRDVAQRENKIMTSKVSKNGQLFVRFGTLY